MRRLLASPRRRRRLAWALVPVVAAAVVVGVALRFPGPEAPRETAGGPGWVPPKQPVPVRRTKRALVEPLSVAAKFISTAVSRRHVADSWDLVAPSMREGYTRAEWAKGEIPVIPYPVDVAKWRLDYSFANSVSFKVALFPPKGRDVRAAVFNVDLRAFGSGDSRRWLVESFTPGPFEGAGTTGGPPTALGLPDLAPTVEKRRLGAAWLLFPVALLSLAVLVPLAFGILHWRRGRQAERAFAAGNARLS